MNVLMHPSYLTFLTSFNVLLIAKKKRNERINTSPSKLFDFFD